MNIDNTSEARTQSPDANTEYREKFIRRRMLERLWPLIEKSVVEHLDGLPYPVQFRNRGAHEGWQRELSMSASARKLWQSLAQPDFTCDSSRTIFEEILLTSIRPENPADALRWEQGVTGMADQISANLLYQRRHGAMIEVTPALEMLLMQSDIDSSLPVGMLAPPFAAQYLRFGEHAARSLTPPGDRENEEIDGVFCFVSPAPASDGPPPGKIIEFIVIMKRDGCFSGYYRMQRPIESPDATLSEWVGKLSTAVPAGCPADENERRMIELVAYLAKLFLYLGLKEARRITVREYTDAQRRVKREPKLARKIPTLYDRIVVGPATLPFMPGASSAGHAVAPHWRRGHFRMHAHGPGYSEHKLIFIAPVLVHSDSLADGLPSPKTYRAA